MTEVEYGDGLIRFLEEVWGEGWLSPGGAEEVDRIVDAVPIAGRRVLDIGCGTGGITMRLAATHGAASVVGVDVEAGVLRHADARLVGSDLAERVRFERIDPGPLPFADGSFDVVFSKDAMIHIADKHALFAEVFRVLVPGGNFAASDWLIGHDGEPSPAMRDYMALEGLSFAMASPRHYAEALHAAGFVGVETRERNRWYREVARAELARLEGPLRGTLAERLGDELVRHNIETWRAMLVVLDTGEHRPTHLRARKPSA